MTYLGPTGKLSGPVILRAQSSSKGARIVAVTFFLDGTATRLGHDRALRARCRCRAPSRRTPPRPGRGRRPSRTPLSNSADRGDDGHTNGAHAHGVAASRAVTRTRRASARSRHGATSRRPLRAVRRFPRHRCTTRRVGRRNGSRTPERRFVYLRAARAGRRGSDLRSDDRRRRTRRRRGSCRRGLRRVERRPSPATSDPARAAAWCGRLGSARGRLRPGLPDRRERDVRSSESPREVRTSRATAVSSVPGFRGFRDYGIIFSQSEYDRPSAALHGLALDNVVTDIKDPERDGCVDEPRDTSGCGTNEGGIWSGGVEAAIIGNTTRRTRWDGIQTVGSSTRTTIVDNDVRGARTGIYIERFDQRLADLAEPHRGRAEGNQRRVGSRRRPLDTEYVQPQPRRRRARGRALRRRRGGRQPDHGQRVLGRRTAGDRPPGHVGQRPE